jgi:hypothetical protein
VHYRLYSKVHGARFMGKYQNFGHLDRAINVDGFRWISFRIAAPVQV